MEFQDFLHLLNIVLSNWEVIMSVLLLMASALRLTAWGKANKEALDAVVSAIEEHDREEIEELKQRVQQKQNEMKTESAGALERSVRRASPDKQTPTRTEELIALLAGKTKNVKEKKS